MLKQQHRPLKQHDMPAQNLNAIKICEQMKNYIPAQGQAVVHVVGSRAQSRVTSCGDSTGQTATGVGYSTSFCGLHPLIITSLLFQTHSLTLPQVAILVLQVRGIIPDLITE
jgi:hypothetical protein